MEQLSALTGEIIRTTDGGKTGCFNQLPGQIRTFFSAVSFTDSLTGTVVGLGGAILKTTDAGQTWVSEVSGVSAQLLAVSFTDINHGHACGRGGSGISIGYIIGTSDGGNSWVTQDVHSNTEYRGISFTDANNGTAVGVGPEATTRQRANCKNDGWRKYLGNSGRG